MAKEHNWKEILGWEDLQIEDLRFIGYMYAKQGKYDIALTFFEALSILNPDNAYDLQTVGAIYLQMGNNINALNHLEKAIKIEPEHYPTRLNRIKALYLLGYKDTATQQARELGNHPNASIAKAAEALIYSYA